jgi:hypothetical protein
MILEPLKRQKRRENGISYSDRRGRWRSGGGRIGKGLEGKERGGKGTEESNKIIKRLRIHRASKMLRNGMEWDGNGEGQDKNNKGMGLRKRDKRIVVCLDLTFDYAQ